MTIFSWFGLTFHFFVWIVAIDNLNYYNKWYKFVLKTFKKLEFVVKV